MKKGEKKRQARQEKKRVGRQEARQSARAEAHGLVARLARDAARYPLVGCWVQVGWDQSGMALATVARRLPVGGILYAKVAVDLYCMGVKNALTDVVESEERWRNQVLPRIYEPQGGSVEVDADLAHQLLYGAVDYAARWGFRPHRAFATAQRLLDPRSAHPDTGRVTFGYQGKPFYIQGPYDKAKVVVEQLRRTAGEGNFDYLLMVGEGDTPLSTGLVGELLEGDDAQEYWDEDADLDEEAPDDGPDLAPE